MEKKTPYTEKWIVLNGRALIPVYVLAIIASYFLLTGCASVNYTPVKDEAKAKGLRYYDTSPYILMYRQNDQWVSQLIYIDDQTKEYQATVWAWLSQNNSSFTFSTNGVLTDISSALDTTVIPNAVLTAAAGLGAKLASGSGGNQLSTLLANDDVALFKIVKIHSQWAIIGAGAPAK